MIPPGTYTLNSELTITVAVTLQGAGAADTIIQAATTPGVAGYRVFDITATGTVALLDLTVRHGATSRRSGGAISGPDPAVCRSHSQVVFNVLDVDALPTGAAAGGLLFPRRTADHHGQRRSQTTR
jgi:hypothetical protein